MSNEDDELKMSRRNVLLSTGAGATLLGLGGHEALGALTPQESEQTEGDIRTFTGQDTVTQSACAPNCRGKCPLDVFTRDGKIKKVQPHIPEDERFKRGCVLGMSHTQRVYDPTRIKYPMVRESWSPDNPNPDARGEGANFVRVSWDEALDLVAQQMEDSKARDGAESILWHAGSGNDGIGGTAKSRLASMYGGTTDGFFYGIDTNVGQGFRRVASNLWGAFLPPTNAPQDWKNARTLIFWGTDLFRSQHQMDTEWVHSTKENGCKWICVDPVYTATAEKADLWLPIKPGKDTYLALAMMEHIFSNDLYDEDFLRKRTTSPALVDTDSGSMLEAGDVLPSPEDPSSPVAMNAQTGELVELLPETDGPYALTGSWTVDGTPVRTGLSLLRDHVSEYTPAKVADTAGLNSADIETAAEWLATRGPGGIMPSYGLGRYLYGHVFGQAYAILMALTGDYGNSGNIHNQHINIWGTNQGLDYGDWAGGEGVSASPTTGVGYKDIIKKMENDEFNVIYAMESNMLGNNFPDRHRWQEAMSNVDTIVWADMHHTDSVQHSDIILPVSHWFEREDVVAAYTHPHVMYRHKVQDPLWESHSDYWIFDKLANKLGLEDAFVGDKHEELRQLVGRDDRVDFDELYEKGTVNVDYEKILYQDEFGTDTGRINMYDDAPPVEKGPNLPDDGVSLEVPKPIEGRTAEDYEKSDQYPFMFMQKHGLFRIHSQYEYLDWLREVNPEPHLDIHPSDAKEQGIANGDYVRVYNDKGEMVVKAKYNNGIQPGLVNTDHGWWSRDYVKGHHNNLTDAETAEVGMTFAFYDTRVAIEPAPDSLDTSKYDEMSPPAATDTRGDSA